MLADYMYIYMSQLVAIAKSLYLCMTVYLPLLLSIRVDLAAGSNLLCKF